MKSENIHMKSNAEETGSIQKVQKNLQKSPKAKRLRGVYLSMILRSGRVALYLAALGETKPMLKLYEAAREVFHEAGSLLDSLKREN